MKSFLKTLGKLILKSFSEYNIIWHIIAIVLTYIIVTNDFDWKYFIWTRNLSFSNVFFPAVIIGGVLPVFVIIATYFIWKFSSKKENMKVSLILTQAVLIGSIISSIYKAFTGRIQPDIANTTIDISKEFLFGFLQHGIFWGWPSSHTTIAFAMAWSLIITYPKNKWLIFLTLIYALYIGIGVSLSIHWFSDFIAGAIIGTVIGITVGKFFKEKPSL